MFLLLTQILLWLLVTFILYNLLLNIIPRPALTLLGGLFLFAVIVLAFFFPNDSLVAAAWDVLSFPLKPLGASILLLSLALNRGLGASRNLILAALLILLVSSTPFFANLLAQRVEFGAIQSEQRRVDVCQGVCPDSATTPGAQAAGSIVVLGRGTTQPTLPGRAPVQLTDTGDRILYAAQLYEASGSDPLVIVSPGRRGGLAGSQNQTVEANDIATLLSQLGVPRNRIVIEPEGVDLRTSAEEVDQILRSRGLSSRPVILVTSGFNSRRARLTFSDFGLNVIPRPVDFFGSPQAGPIPTLPPIQIRSFLPNVEALAVTTRIVEEFFTSIYYYLRGWLAPVVL